MRAIADEAVLASKTARRQRERRLRNGARGKTDSVFVDDRAGGEALDIEQGGLQPHERMFLVEEWS